MKVQNLFDFTIIYSFLNTFRCFNVQSIVLPGKQLFHIDLDK